MTWDTSVLRRDAKPIICLEIVLDETTLYYAVADLREDDRFWEGRIISVSSLSRSVDPLNAGFNVNDVTVTLNNNEHGDTGSAGHFGPLLGTHGFKNRTANIYLKFAEDDGTIESKQVFSGLCSPQQLTAGEFTLGIRPAILDKLGVFQRTVDIVAFPNAPDGTGTTKPSISNVGKGLNIILGNMTSSIGAVELIMVDKTTNSEKFAVAQHAVTAVDAVYRLRNSALEPLTLTNHYTVNTYATDGNGDAYSYIQLASGVWAEGDRYFASVRGIFDYYIDLDGSTEYAYATDHTDFSPNGSFTLETMILTNTVSTTPLTNGIISKWDWAGVNASFLFSHYESQLRLYISSSGSAVNNIATPLGFSLSVGLWYHIVVSYNNTLPSVRWFIDGVEYSNTMAAGTLPNAVFNGSGNFMIGNANGSGKFNGRIAVAAIKHGALETTSYLEPSSCRGYWSFDNSDLTDSSGNGHTLTGVNITSADYGVDANPVSALRRMIGSTPLGYTCLDVASWEKAHSNCIEREYDTNGYFGACIPVNPGEVESPGDQWNLLQEICRGFNHALTITTDGKIGIKSIDAASESSSSSLVRYVERNGDFTPAGLDISLDPFGNLVNSIRYLFKHAHNSDSSYESYVQGDDVGSQDYFGLVKSAVWNNRCARHLDMAKDVLGRELGLIAGKSSKIQWTVPGLWGLQSGSDLGDFVELYHKRGLEDWTTSPQQIVVTDLKANLQEGTVNVGGVTAGESLGPVKFTTQRTESLVATADMFIGNTQIECGNNTFTDATGNVAYGNLSYLRHGHHFANSEQDESGRVGPCDCAGLGYGDINWRTLFRWKLPSATWSGRTIVAVTIQLQVIDVPSLLWSYYLDVDWWDCPYPRYRSGWSGGEIHKLDDTVANVWTEAGSKWIDLNPGAPQLQWDDGYISTLFGSFSGGTGTKSVELSPTGIEMFQNCCDAPATGQGSSNDEVNLVLQSFNGGSYTQACKIASRRHSTVVYRPKAIIVYTATG